MIWVKQRAPYLMRHLPLLHGLGLIPSPEKVTLSLRDTNGKTRQIEVVTDLSQPNIWKVFPNPSSWINLPQTLGSPLPL
jgi:hypothetical protein